MLTMRSRASFAGSRPGHQISWVIDEDGVSRPALPVVMATICHGYPHALPFAVWHHLGQYFIRPQARTEYFSMWETLQ